MPCVYHYLHLCHKLESESAATQCFLGSEVVTMLNESDKVEQPGTYLLKDSVACDGNITSWHMCAFYSNNVTQHSIAFGVFRRTVRFEDTYAFHKVLEKHTSVDTHESKGQKCYNWTLSHSFPVKAHDRLAVIIPSCYNESCPYVPSLNESGQPVLYVPSQDLDQAIPAAHLENGSMYMHQRINVQARIGECNALQPSVLVVPDIAVQPHSPSHPLHNSGAQCELVSL